MSNSRPWGAADLHELAVRAFDIVDSFVAEWKDDPRCWPQEIDVQAELVSRIRVAATELDQARVAATHSHWPWPDMFSRVVCEPYVIPPGVGKSRAAPWHPDIVVWDDRPAHGSDWDINQGCWPMQWVCEVKYKSTQRELEQSRDEDRVYALVNSPVAASGCVLELMDLKQMPASRTLGWSAPKPHVWIYRGDTSAYDAAKKSSRGPH